MTDRPMLKQARGWTDKRDTLAYTVTDSVLYDTEKLVQRIKADPVLETKEEQEAMLGCYIEEESTDGKLVEAEQYMNEMRIEPSEDRSESCIMIFELNEEKDQFFPIKQMRIERPIPMKNIQWFRDRNARDLIYMYRGRDYEIFWFTQK